jgi:uncharacterized protein (DUF1778 family)
MARPKKDPDERRTETLAFRLTPTERIRIEQAAARAGLPPSAYARMQAIRGRVVSSERRTLAPDLFDEPRRIGVNLNQLTRLAHIREEPPPELPHLCAALDRFLAKELAGYGAQGRS